MNNVLEQVPDLSIAIDGPLQYLEKHLLENQIEIECWLRKQWRLTPPPVYASVDLRNSGFKTAPVDTNLFPAGFNNLNPVFLPLAIQAVQAVFEQLMPGCSRILIVPENHTRNPFYFENLATIQDIFIKAGFAARIGSLLEEVTENKIITLGSGRTIVLEPVRRNGDRLEIDHFSPCLILLNNDLSSGIPPILEGLKQPIYPGLNLGWSTRMKSNHFELYSQVVAEFGDLIGIDPWLLSASMRRCSGVNFLKREGEENLVEQTNLLLQEIQRKYDAYGIKEKPYVVIKAETGTYGMGVLIVHSADEILSLNRKKRSEMSMAKGNREIRDVILQEGVYTFETWKDAVAEPVVYMLGQYVIGGFYRVHTGRGITDNLNAPGMHFVPLAFVEPCNKPQRQAPNESVNRFYSYGVIARLALVAAAREQANS